jgi:hypothetical protein
MPAPATRMSQVSSRGSGALPPFAGTTRDRPRGRSGCRPPRARERRQGKAGQQEHDCRQALKPPAALREVLLRTSSFNSRYRCRACSKAPGSRPCRTCRHR